MRLRIAVSVLAVSIAAACGSGTQTEPQREPAIAAAPTPAPAAAQLRLPKKAGSMRFAAIGDAGRGDRWQYEVSAQMQQYRELFPFDFIVMLGDNVYDGGTADDYRLKFELPYKAFREAGVKFYATIGNHDDPNQPAYAPFNMGGARYYTVKPESLAARLLTGTDVRFFMIDTERIDRTQLAWIEREMGGSDAEWKIPIFHRPIYTSGRYALPGIGLRRVLEPLFVRHGVRVAFSGHEHFYERTKPQQGITYFISGGAGSLRIGDIRRTGLTERGFDQDFHFMLVEISGDELYFQAISRTGATIAAGKIDRKAP